MRVEELEVWVRRVLGDVEDGRTVEDSRIELKRQFPDPLKAAKQLAGHANAARSAHVLWIVGASDTSAEICGVDDGELENWLPQVESHFDELAPPLLLSLRVPWRGCMTSALLFDAARRPYVIREDGRLHVKWRRGDHTIDAGRGELLELLVEAVELPSFEVVSGRLTVYPEREDPPVLRLELDLYQERRLPHVAVVPNHRTLVTVAPLSDGSQGRVHLELVTLRREVRSEAPASTMFLVRPRDRMPIPSGPFVSAKQLELSGPARVSLTASGATPKWLQARLDSVSKWEVQVEMPVVDGGTALVTTSVEGDNPPPRNPPDGGDTQPLREMAWRTP